MFAKQIHSSPALCYFVRSFAISRGCPKNGNTSPGPLMERSIKIVRQLEKVCEPYRIMFKELREKKKQLPSQCFWKEKKKIKKHKKHCLGGGGFADLYFSQEVLEPKPREKRGMSVWWAHCLLFPRWDAYRAVLILFVLLQCRLFSIRSCQIVRWAMCRHASVSLSRCIYCWYQRIWL